MRVLAICFALLAEGTAFADAAAGEKMHGTAKSHSIMLTVNVASAIIMENDLLAGHSGDRLDSAPGPHDFTISAPGYIPRLIHVFQPESELGMVRNVTLLPVPDRTATPEIDFNVAKVQPVTRNLEDLNSLCAIFNNSGQHLPSTLALSCNRRTVLDDLRVFGTAPLFDPADKPGADLVKTWEHASDESYYWSAEDNYAQRPDNRTAINLVAFSALRRKNCTRLNEITLETTAAKLSNPGLLMLRGLCLELANKADKAVALYQAAYKLSAPPAADIAYQQARAAYNVNGKASILVLERCAQITPQSYPCAEALAQVLTLTKEPGAASQILQTYHRVTSVALRAWLKNVRWDPVSVGAEFDERPFNLELALAAVGVGARDEKVLQQAQLISDPATLKAVVTAVERKLPRTAVSLAYKALAYAFPKDPNAWVKVAGVLSAQGNCKDAIVAVDKALSLISDPERHAALVVNRADCLVRLERFSEAKTQLLSVIASGHETWQAHYNLGIVHERLGSTKDAIDEYRLALQGEMPASLRAQVEQRLEFESSQNSKHAH